MSDYHVLDSLVLDQLYQQPGPTLYRFLKTLRKDSFSENERIVFYNYSAVGTDLLDHLYHTLLFVDIPTFFVLIISNQPSTKEYFKNKIEVNLVNISETPRLEKTTTFGSQNQFCAHAWVGVHVFPTGRISPCCNSKQSIRKVDGSLYNINDSTLEEVLNSPWMNDLRQSFRDNKPHDNCSDCIRREANNQESKRTISVYNLENIYGDIDWDQEGQLMFFGGHLGNICNFKCRICNEEYSSSIANEKLSLLPAQDRKTSTYYLINKNSSWVTETKFWDRIKENQNIKNFEIEGGEPFYLKQNIEFVNWLVDSNLSQDTIFHFTTNGSVFPDILSRANNFTRLNLTVSIDNLGDRFELERYGTKWKTVENNVKKMVAVQRSSNNFKVGVSIAVNIQNVYYLPEILDWATDIGFNSYYLNYVYQPSEFALSALTKEAQQLVLDKLSSIKIDDHNNKILDVISRVSDATTSDGTDFCARMRELDQLRNQNFAKTHAEIAKAMGYL